MNNHLVQDIIEELLKLHGSKKYLTYDDIMDVCDYYSVPLTRTEDILVELTDRGCQIFDHVPSRQEVEASLDICSTFESTDYAQIDYVELYNDVLKIDPELKSIIDYARKIRPAQHGEASYIFRNLDNISNARNRLFDMNFRFVVKIAYQQYFLCDEYLSDLIQLGSAGLLLAIDKYDVNSGTPFSAYANSWIFQSIGRGTRYRKNGCYFPEHISVIMKGIDRLAGIHICRKCGGIRSYCPSLISEIQEQYQLDYNLAETLLTYTQEPISYELAYENECEFDSSDDPDNDPAIINKNNSIQQLSDVGNPYDAYCKIALESQVKNILKHLSQREQEVIKYRFGFTDGREWTLEEVSTIYGVTRERIRQIESKSIRKLRHPTKCKTLYDFWEQD